MFAYSASRVCNMSFLCLIEQRNCVFNRSSQIMQGIGYRAEWNNNLFLVSFQFYPLSRFSSTAWPSSLCSFNSAHDFYIFYYYFLLSRIAEFPQKSVNKQFVLFSVVCASVFGEPFSDYSYDLASDSEDILCCTELRILCFICSEHAFVVEDVPCFLCVRQSIHCLIA
jgi:hypothetical protein